jgi:nucleotide-binding universal stress UspA family protein
MPSVSPTGELDAIRLFDRRNREDPHCLDCARGTLFGEETERRQTMKTFRKILCPTDFSEASYEAVKMASDLAEHFAAQLTLVHVVPPATSWPESNTAAYMGTPLVMRVHEDEVRKKLENKLGELIGNMISKNVQAQSKVLCCGDPAITICDLADEENIDLIVIATHGMTGWRHYVQGSVTQQVIQHTVHPVLLVRGRASKK